MSAFDDIDWDELMAHAPGALWLLPDMDTIPTEPEIPMPAEIEETARAWDAQIESVFSLIGVPSGSGIVAATCRAVWAQISAAIMAHRRECIAASGAHTELDYYGQETDTMPIAPPQPLPRFRIWSPDYTTAIWESRGANELEAAKRFMADHGIEDAPMTIDYGNPCRIRWSGRIFRPARDAEYQIHDANAYLRHLTLWPNPAFAKTSRSAVAVIAQTKARAEEIALSLGIDAPWLFGNRMASTFDGLRVDRVLIDADSAIDPAFIATAHANARKTPGGTVSFVTVRDFR